MKNALVSAAALATLTAVALGAPDHARAQDAQAPAVPAAPAAPQAVPPVEILAWNITGSGCPTGTAHVLPGNSDGSGQAITITFDEYETKVNGEKDFHQLDCQINLKLKAPRGKRQAVAGIKYDGLANIKAGQQAKFSAIYNWRNAALVADSNVETLAGPYNDQYTFQHTVDVTQWSACESEEVFSLSTFMTLQNARPRAIGTFRLSQTELDLQSNVKRGIIIDLLLGACPQR